MTAKEALETIKIGDIVFCAHCSAFMDYEVEEMEVTQVEGEWRHDKFVNVMFTLRSVDGFGVPVRTSADNIFKTQEEAMRRARELQKECGHRIITEKEYQEFMEWKRANR